ncbi:glucosaminidase domain-containing protein [Saccharospirillum salsuginis]|uniref:Glycoside hydrolase family 73 n=1 Tax=Saccharospirillum salsuginis TaxID=418750 RepID=A0A918NJW6_9GAMM|nr:glucosaminidase domain-containing protein [Saccharospirillum salsuginis]GGX73493.1 glycoside hydrolase family 73 [Saccharospirillum salsuginis]
MSRLLPIIGLALSLIAAFTLGLIWQPQRPTTPDFTQYTAGDERKAQFFDYLLPLVRAENQAILSNRRALNAIIERGHTTWTERPWLKQLAQRYELTDFDPTDPQHRQTLLHLVDVVPPSMALAQAANESAWGTSRFARLGNNYFGQWCYQKGCGLVPNARNEGATHEVAAFDSPRESVRRYMNNINTHNAYQSLRQRRAALRKEGQEITGLALIPSLTRYSERGQAYVDELRHMIRGNDLDRLD